MKHAWMLPALCLLALCLLACSPGNEEPNYRLYLVRHAEKLGGDDPELTIAGHTRAARLAGWLESHPVAAVWSTNTRRTMQTAAPAQAALGVPIQRYDPANLAALASALRDAGQDALVVGHSNTTPQLAALLCDCEVAEMDDTEYDRLLVVEMRDGVGVVTTLMQAEGF